MLKYLWKNKIFIIIFVLMIWLLPNAISAPQQSRTESIITGIGIDKDLEEFEITYQYIIPYPQSTSQYLDIASEKGKTVSEAINKLTLRFGKHPGFANCKVIVFSDSAAESNLIETFDYIMRTKTNTNNIFLLSTPEKAKEILLSTTNLDNNLYVILNLNGFVNELVSYQNLVNLGDFYNFYFSPTKATAISVVEPKEAEQSQSSSDSSQTGESSSSGGNTSSSNDSSKKSQASSSSGSSGSSGSSSSAPSSQPSVTCKGKLLIVKEGKKLLTLNEEESLNLSWFNPYIINTNFEVQNFSDERVENANIVFELFKKDVKKSVNFIKGVPFYTIKIKAYLRTQEAIMSDLGPKNYHVQGQKYSEKLKEEIKRVLTEKMRSAEANFKENKYDVVDAYNLFFKYKTNEFKEYLKSLPEDKYFLEGVNFNYEIEIVQRT